jgi:hypothetical protein
MEIEWARGRLRAFFIYKWTDGLGASRERTEKGWREKPEGEDEDAADD